jgi:hypothetical protein
MNSITRWKQLSFSETPSQNLVDCFYRNELGLISALTAPGSGNPLAANNDHLLGLYRDPRSFPELGWP